MKGKSIILEWNSLTSNKSVKLLNIVFFLFGLEKSRVFKMSMSNVWSLVYQTSFLWDQRMDPCCKQWGQTTNFQISILLWYYYILLSPLKDTLPSSFSKITNLRVKKEVHLKNFNLLRKRVSLFVFLYIFYKWNKKK